MKKKYEDLIFKISHNLKIINYKGKPAVIKKYSNYQDLKWILAIISSPYIVYPFTSLDIERIKREVWALQNLPNNLVPKLYEVNFEQKYIIREYIEGKNISSLDDCKLVVSTLISLHNQDIVLGDTKPSNFIITNNSVKIIDLEQTIHSKIIFHKLWDLYFFLSLLPFYINMNIFNIENIYTELLTFYFSKFEKYLDKEILLNKKLILPFLANVPLIRAINKILNL